MNTQAAPERDRAPRVVFLDAAGTLIRVRGSVGQQYAAVARHFGVEAEPEALTRHFPAAFRQAPPMAFPGADPGLVPGLERDVWRGLVRRVFDAAGLLAAFGDGGFDAYFEAVYVHFESADVWVVYPDVLPALEALARRGCRLGVITNFDSRILTLLDRLGLAPWFGSVTLSSRVGAVKPDRAIFEAALGCHGVTASQALHVGDSPVEDVEGARAAGLGALLVDRAGRYRDYARGARVAALTDVPQLI